MDSGAVLEADGKTGGFRYPSVTADSGYKNEETYNYLKSCSQMPYIKPQTYEKWKKRSFKQEIDRRENMRYNAGRPVSVMPEKFYTPVCEETKKQKRLRIESNRIWMCSL